MIGTIFSLISSPLGKIGGILLAIMAFSGLAFGMLMIHDNSIKAAATAEFNQKQLQKIIKDQEEYIQTQKEIKHLQEQALESLHKQNLELKTKYGTIDSYLKNVKDKGQDGPADEVFKQTLQRLKDIP